MKTLYLLAFALVLAGTAFAAPTAFHANAIPIQESLALEKSIAQECKGDLSHDGMISYADINPFNQFMAVHTHEDFWRANINDDDFVDGRDVMAFVALLQNPGPATNCQTPA